MPDLLKNMYNHEYLRKLATDIHAIYTSFRAEDFVDSIMDSTWDSLELKGRMRQITLNLGKFLPSDYVQSISIIDQVIKHHGTWLEAFSMYFPDFVEVFGQEEAHWDVSIAALERYTMHASAEFAVRPFIIKHEERMMAQMMAWSKHESEHVRRLASEGCRPVLPWAQALPAFKKDPSPILPILEQLKTDPDLYVRKSVANNLNDISKTHPNLVAKIAREWYGKNPLTDWIVKHGCRTLLKRGNRDVLAIFGYDDITSVTVSDFALGMKSVAIGEVLTFSFNVAAQADMKVRLEYAIDYVKSNGKTSRKMFQLSESVMKSGTLKAYTRAHSFTDLSTRKHYPGRHAVTLYVNGMECATLGFDLQ